MRVGIHQPNYAPWIGYFAKMASVDVFVFLDDCQMPIGRSYVSRVQIRTREGAKWLTVPVQRISGESINTVRFADLTWPRKHLRKLQANYGRTPYFESVIHILKPLYEDPGEYLAAFNIRLIRALAGYIGVSPRFHLASEISTNSTGTERLIDIVRAVGGQAYISGSGGVNYQDPNAFKVAEVELDLRTYRPIPYKQQGDFIPGLSLLDAVFRLGPNLEMLLAYPPLNPSPARSKSS